MEIQKVSHKLVSQSHSGRLWLKHFRFVKRRVYKNKDGEVLQEVPFTEHAYLVSCGEQAVWLRPEEVRDLKELLEELEQEAPGPQPKSQQRLVSCVGGDGR